MTTQSQLRVMVLGSGAREHALCWRLAQSPQVSELWCVPGNAGIEQIAKTSALDLQDVGAVVACAKELQVDLVVVGPEGPLVNGIVDALAVQGIAAFGPSRDAAILEGSKVFAKQFMRRWNIPTADFEVFDDAEKALSYVRTQQRSLVVKADGLAGGKGVIVADTAQQAEEGIRRVMQAREFGEAGGTVVIEERLLGQEVSYHVVSDGEHWVPLAAAQDHKRLLDGDQGPNTGGMGAYSPPPIVTAEVERKILERIVEPTLRGMKEEGHPFRGALFVGVMIVDGEPLVLEYNVRFGDPETEVLLARYKGDILPLLLGAASGSVVDCPPAWDAPAALCVVLAASGYPGKVILGDPITGLEDASAIPGVQVFHAGSRQDHGRILTSGGRVLTVTATGDALAIAAERAYLAVSFLHFDGMQYRRDIGARGLHA